MIFIELPVFTRCAETLFSDDELQEMQRILLQNPTSGSVIPSGKGLRKLRVSQPNRGKKGGARVIYYYWHSQECCYLVYAYAKNVAADITKEQLKQLSAVMEMELKNE
jgi:hypothetical protein